MPFVPLQNQNRTQTQLGATPGFRPLVAQPQPQPQRKSGIVYKGSNGLVDLNAEAEILRQKKQIERESQLQLEEAKKQADLQKNQDFLSSISLNGKSYNDLTFEDVAKSMGGNMAAAKSFIDLRNAFQKDDKQKLQDGTIGTLQVLVDLAKSIPGAPGAEGKFIQGPINSVKSFAGYLPEKENFDATVTLVTPLIRKFMGDSGNVGEKEAKAAERQLNLLASPNLNTRAVARKTLSEVLSQASGKSVNLTNAPKTKSSETQNQGGNDLQKLSTEELLKML